VGNISNWNDQLVKGSRNDKWQSSDLRPIFQALKFRNWCLSDRNSSKSWESKSSQEEGEQRFCRYGLSSLKTNKKGYSNVLVASSVYTQGSVDLLWYSNSSCPTSARESRKARL
jgi:hypothetical protein